MCFFLQKGIKKLCQILFSARSNMTINEFAILKEEHRRDIHNAVFFAGVCVLIYIEFAYHNAAVVLVA